MPTDDNTYRYHFKKGNKIIHTGITNDIDRREAEHQRKWGWGKKGISSRLVSARHIQIPVSGSWNKGNRANPLGRNNI